jgi:hypothetical protein
MSSCDQKHGYPQTFVIDPARAMATLDYPEMLALALIYEHWALTEERISGEHRTRLVEWSSDFEAIAGHCGLGWRATDPESPPDLIAFIARFEARALDLYRWETEALANE